MSKQMKEAFRVLGGVWPSDDRQLLHWRTSVGDYIATIHHYTNIPLIQYIGTREEFEACRKEKWHVWSGRGEIPKGVKRLLHSGGDFTIVFNEWKVDWFTDDIVAYTYE